MGYALAGGQRRNWWRCLCQCGQEFTSTLIGVKSCGCLQREVRTIGRLSRSLKTVLLIEQFTGRRMTLKQAAKLFHVKHAALRARVHTYPGQPEKWGLTRRRPPKITKGEKYDQRLREAARRHARRQERD